jgi:predicted AAA+ superfamily ATPase
MQLCALRVGTTLNFSDLAANCGISVITAKSWLALLETSFILFLLPSYHDNLGKRITKSPKLYFYDVGLAATLMRADQETITQQRTVYGALFENMVIADIIKNFNAQGLHYALTFFRDSNKNEIDLIIEMQGKTIPVEIKSSTTMNSNFFDTITWFTKKTQSKQAPIVVYGGDQTQKRTQGHVVSWKDLEDICTK